MYFQWFWWWIVNPYNYMELAWGTSTIYAIIGGFITLVGIFWSNMKKQNTQTSSTKFVNRVLGNERLTEMLEFHRIRHFCTNISLFN